MSTDGTGLGTISTGIEIHGGFFSVFGEHLFDWDRSNLWITDGTQQFEKVPTTGYFLNPIDLPVRTQSSWFIVAAESGHRIVYQLTY